MSDDGLWMRAVERLTDGIIRLAVDGTILEANDAVARLLGVPVDDLLGRNLYRFGHPDDGERIRRRREARLGAGGSLDHYVVAFRKLDGSERVAEVLALDVAGPGGEIQTMGLLRDVTDASRLEEALRRERELVSAVCERVRDGVVILDPEGRVVFANASARSLFRREEGIVGTPFSELVEATPATAPAGSLSWLHGSPEGDAGVRIVRPGGERAPVEIRHLRLGLRAGDVVAVLTDRTEVDAARREAEAYLEILFRHAQEGVFVVSREDGRLVFVNEAACRIAGGTLPEMIGKNFLECLDGDSRTHLEEHLPRFEQGRVATLELVVSGVSGTDRRPVRMTLVGIELRGRPCLLGACHDLSEIDELRRENARLRSLLGEAG